MEIQAAPKTAGATVSGPVGKYRWVICALLFVATAINYIDRQTIAVLKPTLQHEFGWTDITYGDMVFWFQAAYALGYVGFGRLIDKIGARLGYSVAVFIWTVAHIAHAFVGTVPGFIFARIGMGLGESGNFPAGLKSVAEWFPTRERALAISVFNAASGIGAIITPLIVPLIAITFGWRAAFVITGSFSLIWLIVWFRVYRRPEQHPRVTPQELAFIQSDGMAVEKDIPWHKLFRYRETWAYSIGKFLIDPIWWMFLFWLPDFFARRYHLDLKNFGPPLVCVYLLSDVGSIAGGWLSSTLIKIGTSVNVARKVTMLIAAILVLPVMFAMHADNLWLAVGIVGLATAAHQAFSANLYALPGDLFPKRAVGSIVGIGGTAGAIGGMLMAKYAGWVLDSFGTYTPMFVLAGTTYLLALIIVHRLTPRMRPVTLDSL